MYAQVNIQGWRETLLMILAPFQSGELNSPETGVKKKEMRGVKDKMLGRLKRELLWVEAWQKVPLHTSGKKTLSHCVSECVCVCVCTHTSRNGLSTTFLIIPHTDRSTLSLHASCLARLTNHRFLWCVPVCNRPDSVKQMIAPVCHRKFNKKFCLETRIYSCWQPEEKITSFISWKHIQPISSVISLQTSRTRNCSKII